jgi:hypothetical protein
LVVGVFESNEFKGHPNMKLKDMVEGAKVTFTAYGKEYTGVLVSWNRTECEIREDKTGELWAIQRGFVTLA